VKLKPVIVTQPAEYEIIDAVAFYNGQVNELGKQWLLELERVLLRISRYPRSGSLLGSNIRRQLLRRFPYAVLYSENRQNILVVAVMHQHRRPDYWQCPK
jgi:plasmid stabilization system protein ParE